jgi:hypothetical protein
MPIFRQDPDQQTKNENSNHNVPPIDQANGALTTDEIKELFKTMMGKFKPPNKRHNTSSKPLVAQGKDTGGHDITYCWSHGITTDLCHNSKSCNR